MKQRQNLLEPVVRPESPKGTGHFDFEFPTPIFDPSSNHALQNDIVFCGKVMIRQTEPGPLTERIKNPFPARSECFRKPNPGQVQRSGSLRLPATGDSRLLRRSGSSRRNFNGLFGVVKFPVQMELSDMKKRQERREPAKLPEFPENGNGELVAAGAGKSCWKLIRPVRRKGAVLGALAATSFGCVSWSDTTLENKRAINL